jgi:hypothetical protein
MAEPLDVIEFRCTEDTFGMPHPHIDDGAIVILYQDGVAELGRYEAARPPEEPFFYFDHPLNSDTLKPEALAAVREAHPKLDSFAQSWILICPQELAVKARWRDAT